MSITAVPISIVRVRAPMAASSGKGEPKLPREMVHAEVRSVGAHFLGGDGELDGLEQRIGRGAYLRAVRVSPMPERQESDLLQLRLSSGDCNSEQSGNRLSGSRCGPSDDHGATHTDGAHNGVGGIDEATWFTGTQARKNGGFETRHWAKRWQRRFRRATLSLPEIQSAADRPMPRLDLKVALAADPWCVLGDSDVVVHVAQAPGVVGADVNLSAGRGGHGPTAGAFRCSGGCLGIVVRYRGASAHGRRLA